MRTTPRGIPALARAIGHHAFTLPQLREHRRVRQCDLAKRLGVGAPAVCILEGGTDPRLSSVDNYVSALGGRLMLVAVFERPDGTIDRHALRTPDDHRLDLTIEHIASGRWRDPHGPRPAAAARRERLAVVSSEHAGDVDQVRKTNIHRHDPEVAG